MDLIIRPMTTKDKSAIMQMLRKLPQFKPDELIVAEEVLDSYVKAQEHSGYHVRVAEASSSITGYVCYGPAPLTEGTWDIYWLAVSSDEQRQGVGRALITSAEIDIKKAGGRLVLIETSSRAEYEGARRFYRSQGYELACRIANFYAPGDDKLIFQKTLI